MRIVFVSACVATGLLAPAASAAADACMCATSETMTPSYEAMAALAGATEGSARVEPGEQAPAPQDWVLWCSDGDDPRCVPAAPHPTDPPQTLSSSVLGMGTATAAAPDPAGANALPTCEGGNSRCGIRWRVDRPPRG